MSSSHPSVRPHALVAAHPARLPLRPGRQPDPGRTGRCGAPPLGTAGAADQRPDGDHADDPLGGAARGEGVPGAVLHQPGPAGREVAADHARRGRLTGLRAASRYYVRVQVVDRRTGKALSAFTRAASGRTFTPAAPSTPPPGRTLRDPDRLAGRHAGPGREHRPGRRSGSPASTSSA